MAAQQDVTFGFVVAPVGGPGATDGELYEEALADASLGQALGYDAAWIIEHHFSDYYPTPSPIVLLSHIAARCPGLGLGTMVLVTPWYQPLRLAGEIAMLSHLCRGRLHLGLGRGTAKMEFDAFGQDMTEARDRFRETFEILRLAMTGKPFTYDGRYNNILREVTIRPRPVAERISFYGGIGSPPSAEIMADLGLPPLLSPNFPLAVHKDILDRWTARSQSLGHTTDTVRPIQIHVFIGDDDERPRALARHHLSRYAAIQMRHYETELDNWKGVAGYEQFSRYFATLKKYSDPERIDPWLDLQLIGSPRTVAAKLQAYIDIGINYFALHAASYGIERSLRHEMLQRFAAQVAPDFSQAFRRRAAS